MKTLHHLLLILLLSVAVHGMAHAQMKMRQFSTQKDSVPAQAPRPVQSNAQNRFSPVKTAPAGGARAEKQSTPRNRIVLDSAAAAFTRTSSKQKKGTK